MPEMKSEQCPKEGLIPKIIHFFALNSSILGMLIMVILVGMGEKMAERLTAKGFNVAS